MQVTIHDKYFQFPVYPIGSYLDIFEQDGLVYLLRNYDTDYKVLDNKNLEGDTLGLRRIKIPKKQKASLKSVIYNLESLIRYTGTSRKFIDNNGRVFEYKRTKFYYIYSYRILKVTESDSKYIVHLKNYPQRFLTDEHVTSDYVLLMNTEPGFMLYGFKNEPLKYPIKRKI